MQKEGDLRDRTIGTVPAEKLTPLRREVDELTAIFVTILKRSKEK